MYKFTAKLTYRTTGNYKTVIVDENNDFTLETKVTENGVQCILHPKTKMYLKDFRLETKKVMTSDEWFFVNGFQSWSTSPEVRRSDMLKGITPLAKISGFTTHIAAMSGDALIADDYRSSGKFHSFTYTYFRRGENIEFFGSMSERQGYTIFSVDSSKDAFTIRRDVEGVETDSDYELMNVRFISGKYDDVFDDYFASLNLRKPKIKHLSGYTSWYNYFQKIDENIIIRDLNGLDRVKDSVSIFQIDDGYETYVGDWLAVDEKKFPKGMKYCADEIHKKGYLAGIWIAPFSAQRVSRVVKEHPDWLIKDEKGANEWGTFAWNGSYTLDMYNEGAREYIRNFFNVILNDWGYDMVKLDFLYSQAIHPRNGKSRGQIMCEAMDFLRECVGEEKLILGCGVPLGPAFGVVDACRITCDVDLKYSGKFYNKLSLNRELPSAQNSMNNTIFRRHLNQRVFISDPDVFFLRKNNLTFTDEQKMILAKVNNLFGDVLFISDNAGDYGERECQLVREFFAEKDVKIKSAEYINGIMSVVYIDNGEELTFRFNMPEGKIIG